MRISKHRRSDRCNTVLQLSLIIKVKKQIFKKITIA